MMGQNKNRFKKKVLRLLMRQLKRCYKLKLKSYMPLEHLHQTMQNRKKKNGSILHIQTSKSLTSVKLKMYIDAYF